MSQKHLEQPQSPQNQMQSDQPTPSLQKKEPSWFAGVIITAVVGGIIQIIVNHFDAIFAAMSTGFSHANWQGLWQDLFPDWSLNGLFHSLGPIGSGILITIVLSALIIFVISPDSKGRKP